MFAGRTIFLISYSSWHSFTSSAVHPPTHPICYPPPHTHPFTSPPLPPMFNPSCAHLPPPLPRPALVVILVRIELLRLVQSRTITMFHRVYSSYHANPSKLSPLCVGHSCGVSATGQLISTYFMQTDVPMTARHRVRSVWQFFCTVTWKFCSALFLVVCSCLVLTNNNNNNNNNNYALITARRSIILAVFTSVCFGLLHGCAGIMFYPIRKGL